MRLSTAVSVCLVCLTIPLRAQRAECRKPTAQEEQAMDNASRAAQQTVEGPLIALGWALEPRKSDQVPHSVATDANPKRPLMSCWPIYDATFHVTEANPHYAELKSASLKGETAMQTWMAGCLKGNLKGCDVKPEEVSKGIRATTAMSMQIRATENEPYMHGPHEVPIRRLEAPTGIAVAYQEPTGDYEQNTTLCVGPFKPEVVLAGGGRLTLFPFQHPVETPFIENLCLKIRSVPEMADEILRRANWQGFSAGLTK